VVQEVIRIGRLEYHDPQLARRFHPVDQFGQFDEHLRGDEIDRRVVECDPPEALALDLNRKVGPLVHSRLAFSVGV
jgi:hypothetical protein